MSAVTTANAADVAKGTRAALPADPGPSTVRRSASVMGLAKAMVKAQAEIEDPAKNKKADAGARSYRYADLPAVLDEVRPALTKHGLAVMQFPCELDGEPALTTLILHGESGEWLETTTRLRPVKPDPQGIGSALTYCRRYALLSLCGIAADDDDDGKAASQPRQQTRQDRQDEPPPPKANPQLRARYAQRLGECKTPADFNAVCVDLKADAAAGRLAPEDVDGLRPLSRETGARLNAQPAAGGK